MYCQSVGCVRAGCGARVRCGAIIGCDVRGITDGYSIINGCMNGVLIGGSHVGHFLKGKYYAKKKGRSVFGRK